MNRAEDECQQEEFLAWNSVQQSVFECDDECMVRFVHRFSKYSLNQCSLEKLDQDQKCIDCQILVAEIVD